MDMVKIRRAIISVTDKGGVDDLALTLQGRHDVEIVSTGGTAKALEAVGINVIPIDEVTGFPEMMNGRVKTLHPRVHGGLLALRANDDHMAQAEEHGITMIDMVVVNLYEFEKAASKPDATEAQVIEEIDIGGPSMLRSAAKNFESVIVVTSPAQYSRLLAEMAENDGAVSRATRREFAGEVFRITPGYDLAIFNYLTGSDLAIHNRRDLVEEHCRDTGIDD